MAFLHYGVSRLGKKWVLSCENVPVEVYPSRAQALDGAKDLINLAKSRGDTWSLESRASKSPAQPKA